MAGEQILIVEDQRTVAVALRTRLRGLGYNVTGVASTGDEALSKVSELRPDLVLMDIKLGDGMDGIEAARQIRTEHDVPVVYVSAYADQEIIERARETFPAGFINKPFTSKDLLTTIALVLHTTRYRALPRTAAAPGHGPLPDEVAEPTPDEANAGEALVTSDLAGNITFVNLAGELRIGWKRKHLVGHSLLDLLVGLYKLGDNQARAILRNVRDYGIEQSLRQPGAGREHRLPDDVLMPLRDTHGQLFGMALRIGAATAHQRIAEAYDELHALRTAVDPLPVGMLLVSRQMRVVFRNRRAAALLAEHSALVHADHRLNALDRAIDDQLRKLVGNAADSTGNSDATPAIGMLLLEEPMTTRALELIIMPAGSGGDPLYAPAAALYLFDTACDGDVSAFILRPLYHLTATEVELIKLLMKGATLDTCAEALAISVNTVRTHLKHIYQKMGVTRYTELVQRVGAGPAAMLLPN
ncbi:MAG: response regulator [Gammaproteobacteria bacterium]|nr:response regulator [Gammaproteobacteria bacterium]